VSGVSQPYRRRGTTPRRVIAGIACWLSIISTVVGGCAARSGVTNPAFSARIEDYLRLRDGAVAAVGRIQVTAKPGELRKDVIELTKQLQTRRRSAREGDILGGAVAVAIRTSLWHRLSREDGATIIAAIRDVQPDRFAPEVNTPYRDTEPRSTVPAQILRVLPRLPEELSYRFVGRDLLLLDKPTGLVLDVLRGALPSSAHVS
jgi:hypothetical protein